MRRYETFSMRLKESVVELDSSLHLASAYLTECCNWPLNWALYNYNYYCASMCMYQ